MFNHKINCNFIKYSFDNFNISLSQLVREGFIESIKNVLNFFKFSLQCNDSIELTIILKKKQ